MMTKCERILDQEITTRDPTKRFLVNLSLRNEILGQIGDTKSMAICRFYAFDKRLESCSE